MKRLLAASAIAAALVLTSATPAFAHAILSGTIPTAGQRYTAPPTEVVLHFTERVEASLGAVRLFDGRGARIDVGRPRHDGASTLRTPLPKLGSGVYVVTWRVISSDGHPVQGAFTFSVGSSAAPGSNAQGLARRLLASQGGSTVVGVAYAVVRFLAFAALAILIGGLVMLVVCWPAGDAVGGAGRVLRIAWVVALAATVVAIGLDGAYAGGLSAGHVLSPSVWSDVMHTRVGRVLGLRALTLLLTVLLVARVGRQQAGTTRRRGLLVALMALALVVATSLGGHAASGSRVALGFTMDVLHVGAISVWIGALVMLVFAILRDPRTPRMREAVTRFSQVALACVTVVVASGLVQAWRQVGSVGALKTTDYGRLLIAKFVTFALLIVVASASRDQVNRAWRRRASEDDEETDANPEALTETEGVDAHDVARLRRAVGVEVAFAVVVFSITALLVNAAPARAVQNKPFSQNITASADFVFSVQILPARVGVNQVHLSTLKADGSLTDELEAHATLSELTRGVAPITVPLRRLGPGHYVAYGVEIPFSGKWKVSLTALVTDTQEEQASAVFTVR